MHMKRSWVILLLLLAVAVVLASSQEQRLRLTHSYPENRNFNRVTLTCLFDGMAPSVETDFLLNGTDIMDMISNDNVLHYEPMGGIITFTFGQAQEGSFSCSLGPDTKSNLITLAAEPSRTSDRLIQVDLPDAVSAVPTLLVCDIQPGALVQRYSVQWFRQYPGVTELSIYKGEVRFELTLNVTSSLNGSQHLCVVTVNHDGTLNQTYPGGIVTLRTTLMDQGNTITPTIIIVTAAIVLVCIFCAMHIMCICGALYYNRNRKHRAQNAPAPPTSSPAIALTELSPTPSSPPPTFPALSPTSTTFSPLPSEFFDILPSSGNCIGTEGGCTPLEEQYHYGICLRIPQGAIPEGTKVSIDIGVALYGPFQYPKGLRPVSPVFWICVHGEKNFQFQKNVKITIYHCLSVGNGSESLGLTFLKANHDLSNSEMYELQPVCQAKCDQNFSRPDAGVLSIDHFCCLCICCEDVPSIASQIKYSLVCVKPPKPNYDTLDEPIIYFYVTYSLQYCIQSVVQKEGCIKLDIATFCFANEYLELKYQGELSDYITHTVSCADHHLYEGKRITSKMLDFHELPIVVMSNGIKPWPFFRVMTNQEPEYTERVFFSFIGAVNELKFEVAVQGKFGSHTVSNAPSTISGLSYMSRENIVDRQYQRERGPMCPQLLQAEPTIRGLVNVVAAEIPTKWREFGYQLHISTGVLNSIEQSRNDPQGCFTAVFERWESNGQPPFTWGTVLEVLRSQAMRQNKLADNILTFTTV